MTNKIIKFRPYLNGKPYYISYSKKIKALTETKKLKKRIPNSKITIRKEKSNKWIKI